MAKSDGINEKESKISDNFISALSKRPELIVPIKTIKKMNEIYKTNFSVARTFDELKNKFYDYKTELEKSPAAICEIQKQYNKKMALQPSILTECFMAQTIADILGLENFVDYDAGGSIPAKLGNTILRMQNNKAGTTFRYLYFNNNADIVLAQCGDSSTIDAMFIKERIGIRIEFKEELAKINEVDIQSYDDNGKLILTEDFKEKYPYYVPFVEIFNKKTTVFEMIGHNFKLVDYLDEENSKRIIESVANDKIIDVYVMLKTNKLIPILAKNLSENVEFTGSEIRTAGKNDKKLWSVNFVKSEIVRLGGKIENGKVYLPEKTDSYATGRGTSLKTRYKINSLIFVRLTDTFVENGIISFDFDKIRQLKPTVSLHLSPL